MLSVLFAGFLTTLTALAASNHEVVAKHYAEAKYPEMLFEQRDAEYIGECYNWTAPNNADSLRIQTQAFGEFGLKMSLRGDKIAQTRFYTMQDMDYRTTFLRGAKPNRVEIRQWERFLVLNIYDGSANNLYCWAYL